MSDTATVAERDTKGRFQPGNTGNGGGRPRGSRNKLGEAFLEDLRDAWNEVGAVALRRCADEDPAAFCRIVASLMPKDVNVNMTLDAGEFASRFRTALELLGNPPELPKRRPMRVIDHG